MEFCEKILLLRRGRKMTQTDMADLLGVTRQSVYKWEKGESYPEAMTLFAMREVFGISIDALLDPAYVIEKKKDGTAEVMHVGEDIPDATDFTVTKRETVEEINPNLSEEDVDISVNYLKDDTAELTAEIKKTDIPEGGDGSVTDRKKKGLFSRIFR